MSRQSSDSSTGFSRREFFRGVGATSVAAGLLAVGLPDDVDAASDASAAGTGAQGLGEVKISLNINGQKKELSVEPRITLLDALRNRLDFTGAKKCAIAAHAARARY